MSDDSYVTNGSWVATSTRVDTIDEIADQFERPSLAGAQFFWDDVSVRRVMREASLAPRRFERRAG